MSAVNIIRASLFVSEGTQLEGEIKAFPQDFEVRELHSAKNIPRAEPSQTAGIEAIGIIQ